MHKGWSFVARGSHHVSFPRINAGLVSYAEARCFVPRTRASRFTLMSATFDARRYVHRAAVAFGSNMGDRLGTIEAAISEMNSSGLKVLRKSPVYETKPMYYMDQGLFLNGVCQVETDKEPLALLDTLQAIETKLGRERAIQKGPRTLDLDLILYDDHVVQDPRLSVPHAGLQEREFVLRPLHDIMPEAVVPVSSSSRKVSELYHSLRNRDDSMSPVTVLSDAVPLIRAEDPRRQTHVMAILNLTPDSFSDGGMHYAQDPRLIRQKVYECMQAGATIIDIGGQSTRPNAELLSAETELERILPAIKAIRSAPELQRLALSVDTFYAQVAREAVAAGADLINDVSAGVMDPAMLPTVAELGKTIILMHMRGTPQTMTKLIDYPGGVVEGVASELAERIRAAEAAGIPRWRMVLDPGIGFAKNQAQNLELLRDLPRLRKATGHRILQGLPWMVGTSRKGFIGHITGVKEADRRVMGTAAAVAASIAGGADIVRVHDVKAMTEVRTMADAIYRPRHPA